MECFWQTTTPMMGHVSTNTNLW